MITFTVNNEKIAYFPTDGKENQSPHLSLPVLQVPSEAPSHLNCDTLEQILTRLGLQQFLDILQAENLDLESLVIHAHKHTMDIYIQSVMRSYKHIDLLF